MKIVIAGAGEVGSHLAKMLSNESNEITVIDMNNDRLEALRSNTDVITVEGNPSAIKVLQEAGVDLWLDTMVIDAQTEVASPPRRHCFSISAVFIPCLAAATAAATPATPAPHTTTS